MHTTFETTGLKRSNHNILHLFLIITTAILYLLVIFINVASSYPSWGNNQKYLWVFIYYLIK